MSGTIVVIGSGVDELVAAHYLARAGHTVTVLEQHEAADDACRGAGWIPPGILRDLEVGSAAGPSLELDRADPWMAVVLPDGGRLELWREPTRAAEAIRRLSARDATRWPDFCERMARLARVLERLYAAPPPDLMSRDWRELARIAGLALGVRRRGRSGMEEFLRLLPMAVADLLDDWFECDALKGVLAGAAVMHLCQGPRSGGTAFRLLHHHVGNAPGVFRPVRSNLRPALEARPGVALRRHAPVARIATREHRIARVVLASGEEIATSLVISGADPKRTLLEWLDPGGLDPEFARAVRHIRARGVAARVELTLARAPGFAALAFAPSLDYLERAYDDAKYGRISAHPYLEARADEMDTQHRVEVHVQYAPYTLAEGAWDAAQRKALGDRVVEMLTRALPGFGAGVIARRVLAPCDLEARYGFPEGQADHAELALDQSLWMRPLPGWASYRTPIEGLYLCGPAAHPGGAIAGAAGANAARVVLHDLRRTRRN